MRKSALLIPALTTAIMLMAVSCNAKTNTSVETGGSEDISVDMSNDMVGDTGTSVSTDTKVAAKTTKITYTSSGFSPASVTVNQGDTVEFVNNSGVGFWVASDPHPIHTGLAGFDAGKTIPSGSSYKFTFNSKGSFGFHNHLNSGHKGTVTVK